MYRVRDEEGKQLEGRYSVQRRTLSYRVSSPVVCYTSGMTISDEQLNEFISIYNEEFGEELDHLQAQEMASGFLSLYEALASRPPNEAVRNCVSEGGSMKT
jgi:hypothetical protein